MTCYEFSFTLQGGEPWKNPYLAYGMTPSLGLQRLARSFLRPRDLPLVRASGPLHMLFLLPGVLLSQYLLCSLPHFTQISAQMLSPTGHCPPRSPAPSPLCLLALVFFPPSSRPDGVACPSFVACLCANVSSRRVAALCSIPGSHTGPGVRWALSVDWRSERMNECTGREPLIGMKCFQPLCRGEPGKAVLLGKAGTGARSGVRGAGGA